MKRLSWLFVVLLAVTVGWYFLWLQTLHKVEEVVAQNIERLQLSNPKTDVDVHYTLKPTGFPFKAGFDVENVGLILFEKSTNHRAKLTTSGENRVYVSIFDFYKVFTGQPIQVHSFIKDFEGVVDVQSDQDNVQMRFNIARSVGEGVWGVSKNYKGVMSDLDVYVTSEDIAEKRLLTVNSIHLNSSDKTTKGALNGETSVKVSGATFFDLQAENSFEVDAFSFKLLLKNMPTDVRELLDAVHALDAQNATTAQKRALKNSLMAFAKNMAQQGAEFSLEDLSLKIDDFEGELSYQLRLNDDMKPVGQMRIKLKNIDALNHIGGVNEAPVDLSKFTPKGQEEVEIHFESTGQKVLFNGFPIMMFVPSFNHILESYLGDVEDVVTSDSEAVEDKSQGMSSVTEVTGLEVDESQPSAAPTLEVSETAVMPQSDVSETAVVVDGVVKVVSPTVIEVEGETEVDVEAEVEPVSLTGAVSSAEVSITVDVSATR